MLRSVLRSVLILLAAAGGSALLAQQEFKAPRIRGIEDRVKTSVAPAQDTDPSAKNYADRHEAAVAALQAAAKEKTRERAMRYLLISLRRDPDYARALYDLGLLCARDERWSDALSFYREVLQKNPDPQLANAAKAEVGRVEAIEKMESTPAGKKHRQFDNALLDTVSKSKDPVSGLNNAKDLAKLDGSRWEAPALEGVYSAEMPNFQESLKYLEDAARLAPAARRLQIQSAAQVARSESTFTEQKNNADGFWDKQQWESAAKLYASAWENSPSRLDIAMQAATGFLMVDQVPLAVQILARMRDYASPEMDQKITAMLKELGAISDSAKGEAGQPAHAVEAQSAEPAARIRSLIGQLTTPEMELAAKPTPALLDDPTHVTMVPDEALTAPANDSGILSTVSVFELYRKNAGSAPPAEAAASSAAAAPVAATAAAPTAAPPAAAPPPAAEPPLPTPGRPSRLTSSPTAVAPPAAAEPAAPTRSGPTQPVTVTSTPAGASIVFDNNASLTCLTPCEIPLPAGRHTLMATLKGYRDAPKIFNVEKKAASVEIGLDAKRGSVSVQSATPGAPVFLNGKRTDKVTPAQFTLDEGDYDIGVEIGGTMNVQKMSVRDGTLQRVIF